VIITFHSLGDVDAVGSAIALKEYLGSGARILAPDRLISSAGKLAKRLGIEVEVCKSIPAREADAIVLIESTSRAMLPQLKGIEPDCIIDHHSLREDSVTGKHVYIDMKASSVCEIMYEILGRKAVSKRSAFALLAGIIADSARFKEANAKTFRIAAELLERAGVTYEEALKFAEPSPSFEERAGVLKGCGGAEVFCVGEFLVAISRSKGYEAHTASALVTLGADAAFVGHIGKEDAHISARIGNTLEGKVNAAEIMHEIAKMIGGTGGGHPQAAGASGKKPEKMEEALEKCVAIFARELGEKAREL